MLRQLSRLWGARAAWGARCIWTLIDSWRYVEVMTIFIEQIMRKGGVE